MARKILDLVNDTLKEIFQKSNDNFEELYQVGSDHSSKISALESGKATKAEVELERQRINAIASLPEGSTTGDAEIADARVGADGESYASLGEAIRGQRDKSKDEVEQVKSDLSNIDNVVLYPHVIVTTYTKPFNITIPIGANFRIATKSGSNFNIAYVKLNLFDADGNYIDYYGLKNTFGNHRDLINNTGKEIRSVKLSSSAYTNIVITVFDKNDSLQARVDSIETNVGSIKENTTVLNEKVENIEEITKSNIPSFYDDYLEKRIDTLREKDLLIGINGDSFCFITDLHDQNNYYSPYLAKEIIDKSSCNRIVYGGDYINEPNGHDTAAKYLFDRISKFRVIDDAIFMIGNHDLNPYGTGQISALEFYSVANKHIEKFVNTNKSIYFYSDNNSQKIRYFYLNSGVNGTISDTQKSWLKSKAEELDSTWTIVVFTHHGIYTDEKDDRMNIKKYPCIDSINEAFINVIATISCIICGHTHIDLADTSGNYPIICTTCDAHGVQSSSMSSDDRSVGTINEQAFDVFHIDTSSKKVYVTRIGGGQYDVTQGTDYTLNDREFSYQ